MSGWHGIPTPDPYVRPLPQADATGDLPAADAIPQCLDELHGLQPNHNGAASVSQSPQPGIQVLADKPVVRERGIRAAHPLDFPKLPRR